MTEWDEFRELDLAAVAAAMRGDVLIDGRNALDPEAVARRRPALRGHRPLAAPELACARSSSSAARARGCGR